VRCQSCGGGDVQALFDEVSCLVCGARTPYAQQPQPEPPTPEPPTPEPPTPEPAGE